MFKAVISDAKLLRSILAAVSALVEETDFNMSEEGVSLKALDPSHVAMVSLNWPKQSFEAYECDKPIKIRINLSNIQKLLKKAKSDESIEVSYDEASRKLTMILKGKVTKKFIVPTLEAGGEETPSPKLTFNARVKIISSSLKEIIDDAQAIADNVTLEATQEKFIVNATSELSNATFEVEKGSEALLELEVKEPSKATFNLNFLAEMVKAGASASEVATLEFSTNMPIKLEFNLIQANLVYYLAPRIETT
ncbi:MAG: proliferating cell nuclear antigen (pcna) [Candidatus Bathyarchaeia archaeon]